MKTPNMLSSRPLELKQEEILYLSSLETDLTIAPRLCDFFLQSDLSFETGVVYLKTVSQY